MGHEPSVHEMYLSINILDVMMIASSTFAFVLHMLALEHKVHLYNLHIAEAAPFEFRRY